MEIFAVIGVLAIVIFFFKKITSSTNSDKLTLLQLENWLAIYSKEGLFQRSKMATALVVQSVNLANQMGMKISIHELMEEKNKNKESSIDVVNQWIDYIFTEMVKDISANEIKSTPARTVGALLLIRIVDFPSYRQLLK